MRRLGLAIVLLLVTSACMSTPMTPSLPSPRMPAPRSIRVQLVERGATVIRDVPLEEYVQATALSEFAPAAGDQASVEAMLEVQAIISRTYAISHLGRHAREGFDLCSTTHCQLYDPLRLGTSRWAAAATAAVERTSGVVLEFQGLPAQALFHADCGGHTSTSAAVWGGDDRPYLTAHADEGLSVDPHATWEYRVSIDAASRALNSDTRKPISGRLESIEITARDAAGRVQSVGVATIGMRAASGRSSTATPIVMRGEDLRAALTRAFGARSIRSTLFTVRRDGDDLVFAGRGFGHGVGLCQAGALARLRAGAKPGAVLRYYYPGTALARLSIGESHTTH